MKKVLYSSTALAAAAAIALIPTGDAAAAEKAKKIQLGFGGGMTMAIGVADQADSFEKASDADVDGVTGYGSYNTWASSEVEVKGSVKLDSGITVSVEIEFETDQVTANGGNAGIDHSYMKITGGFGDIRIGSTTAVTAVLAQSAPWTGILNPGVDDVFFVVTPAAYLPANGKIGVNNGALDTEALQYISPQFAGLRLGAYVIPDKTTTTADLVPATGGNDGTDGAEYGLIVNYETKAGSVSIKGSAARWIIRGGGSASLNNNAYGAKLGFGDISVGGAYYTVRHEDSGFQGTANSSETTSYNMGILFAPKGYAVGLHYVHREAPGDTAVAGADEKTAITIGAKYDLGPGVAAKASLAWVEYDDELTNDSNNNKGWALVAGINVAF